MSTVEIEAKFRVNDPAALARQLLALGFTEDTPRTFESNVLYDTPEHNLRAARSILRIRRYGERWVLTHKCPPSDFDPAEKLKHRQETETVVADGEAIAFIFEQLGLVRMFAYEKYRTEFSDARGHCVIDETPIGVFAELEGPEDWIIERSQQLDIPRDGLLTLSYGRLFEQWRAETGSTAQQLTFAEVAAAQ